MSYEFKAKKQQLQDAKVRASKNFGPALIKFLNELKIVLPSHIPKIDEQIATIKQADEKERSKIMVDFQTKFGTSKDVTDIFLEEKRLFVDDHANTNWSTNKCWSRLTPPPKQKLSLQFEFLVKLANIALG